MSPFVSTRLLLTQNDVRLVKLAGEGHERAFEALVHRYRRPLLAYCRRLLLPEERAEDALQQALLKAWLALQQGADVTDVKPWLYKIVHNTALNMLRVSGYDYATLTETLQGASAPEDDLDRRIAVRDAFAGLASLPAMQREALLRTAVDGYSHEHVAQAMGLSEGALRGLVYRARATLRTATTALTPSPVLHWALNHRGLASAPLAARLAELGAGSGSIGVGGLLLKGGAVVVTAGALAGGIAASHHHGAKALPSLAASPAAAASRTPSAVALDGGLATHSGQGPIHPADRRANDGKAQGSSGRTGWSPFAPSLNDRPGIRDGSRSRGAGDSGSHEGQPSNFSAGSGDRTGGSSGKDSTGPSSGSGSKDGSGAGSSGDSSGSGSSSSGGSSGSDTSGSGGGSDFGATSGSGDGSGSSGSGSSDSGSSSGSSGGETSSPEATTSSGDGSKSSGSEVESSPGGLFTEPSTSKDGSSTTPGG